MHAPWWVAVPVLVTTVLATRSDLESRTIPNALTGPVLLLGLVAHLLYAGPAGGWNALVGAVVAGGLLFPGWLMRWTGAGDVKLMAAVGAWLGSPSSLYAVLAALIAGGFISLVVAAQRGILWRTVRGAALVMVGAMPRTALAGNTGVRIPFALAILAGSVFALCRPS